MNSQPTKSFKHHGLTLIELMIAMVLGLVVLGGASQIFLGGRAAYGDIQRFTALQENLGFLSDFLGNELRESEFIKWDPVTRILEIKEDASLTTPRSPHQPGVFDGCTEYRVASGALLCVNSLPGINTSQPLVGNAVDFSFNEIHVECPDSTGAWPTIGSNICTNPAPNGIRITFVFRVGQDVDEHEVDMMFALRNNVLK